MDLKELESGVNPDTHWYYQSKKQPLLRFIRSLKTAANPMNLLDIGAGSGFFSYEVYHQFPERFSTALLIDTAYTAEEINASKLSSVQKQHTLPEHIEHSLILMMDVLEHLADDALMLRQLKKNAPKPATNYFFITVPAFQSVWSAHDVYLEHYRRYTKSSLQTLLRNEGYTVHKVYYLYGTLFPLVFIKRKLANLFAKKNEMPQSDMKPLPAWVNTLLLRYSSLEMLVTRYNTFFGLTCVAEGTF